MINDGGLRFKVRKKSGGDTHIVELHALKRGGIYNGQCDCFPFIKTFDPRFRDKSVPIGQLTRCPHIKACIIHVGEQFIKETADTWRGLDAENS